MVISWVASLIARLLYDDPKVIKRGTGETVIEKVPPSIRAQLGLLFNTWVGFLLTYLPWLRHYQLYTSQALGRRYDSVASAADIPGFVEDYGVRLDELEKPLEAYQSLNEFFARKLRTGARPIHCPGDEWGAIQPTDARLVVFPSASVAQQLWIKGRRFSLEELLGRKPLGGQHAVGIARLAPDNYHRFHAPVAGVVMTSTRLGKELFSVKACAINSRINVLCENKRVVLEVASPAFGTVFVVAVGAAQVGSIQLTVAVGQHISKGQELGFFKYGGSSVVLVFDSYRMSFDEDLVANSSRRVETLVRMGTSLGKAP